MSNIITDMGNNKYLLQFPYKPYLVNIIKALPGRQYNYTDKTWVVPKSQWFDPVMFAKKYNFKTPGSSDKRAEILGETRPLPELTIDIDSYIYSKSRNVFMRHYQKQGVARGLELKRYINGDDMGLGKTIQTIAVIETVKAFPCVIICPTSLKENWKREIEDWTGSKALILTDACKNNFMQYHKAGYADYFIVNYESLKKYFVEKIDREGKKQLRLNNIHFKDVIIDIKSVVADEFHRCKSFSTLNSKFVRGIAKGKEYVIGLTGTPVINKPKDLIPQLGIIDQMHNFGMYKGFVNRYCDGLKEASNLKELNYFLNKHCFFRREKSLVLTELPPKQRQTLLCEIDTRKEYVDAQTNLEAYLKEYKQASEADVSRALRGKIMVEMGILKNISARGKLKTVFEFIDDTLGSGQKLIVFGHLKEVIGKIKDHYSHAVSVTGDDHPKNRQIAVDRFQNDPEVNLIICSITAAGVGLTLTASSQVAFVELPWTAAACDQAEDRANRIGQLNSVNCTYFLGNNTIDEYIYEVISKKRSIARDITGDESEVSEEVIDKLFNLFNQ